MIGIKWRKQEIYKNNQARRINQKLKCGENKKKSNLEKQNQNIVKQQIENKIKSQNGITLLVLVITIIILLILAGITISAITGENGIIGNAGKAKEEAEIANEKEILEKATVQAMGNNKYGNIEEGELQEQLDKETGEGKTEATDIGNEFEVVFKESNRYYTIDKDGNVGEAQDVIEDGNPGDITVGRDGETLDGSEEHPYEIWCIEDLVAFSKSVSEGKDYYNENVKLMTTLNFHSSLSYSDTKNKYKYDETSNAYIIDENSEKNLKELITDENGVGFIPIGMSSSSAENRFRGNFDGGNNEIKNIYVNTKNNAGLFGGVFDATVENIKISGSINSTDGNAGGLIGNGPATIRNCSNESIKKAKQAAGGIVGEGGWQSKSLENCYNTGDIYSESSYAGGLAGTFARKINNCYNLGNIEGLAYTGGILGNVAGKIEIVNGFNQGNVKSKGWIAGGIVGFEYAEATVNNCYNIGNITTEGTIVADVRSKGIGGTYINNCYNIGNLQSTRACYAIGDKTINNCYYNAILVGEVEDVGNIEDISQLDEKEFVNILNSYTNEGEQTYPTDWKKWKLGEEGYPVFE